MLAPNLARKDQDNIEEQARSVMAAYLAELPRAKEKSATVLPMPPTIARAPQRGTLRLPRDIAGPIEAPPVLPGQGGAIPSGRSAVAAREAKGPPTPAARPAGVPLPASWTVVHVMDRMDEAFEVLRLIPMATRPRGFANSMPTYAYERSDLIAQVETGELERMMRLQNRVRLSPSAAEISRMGAALAWPMLYLKDFPEVSRAVLLSSLWAATGQDAGRRLRALKINRRAFNRRKVHGLGLIAMALIRDKVSLA